MSTATSDRAKAKTKTTGPYRLKAPCSNCPFRTDVEPYLRAERAQEIADALYDGSDFPCHKTTETVTDEDGHETRERTADSAQCAGALITMEKEGFSNQQVRIAERLGVYSPEALKMDAPVHRSLSDWVMSYRTIPTVTITNPDGTTETLEYEHCGVVADGCEDPAGYSMGGGVASNSEEPTCNPVEGCSFCGSPMCTACRASENDDQGHPQCVYCANPDDEED